MAVRLAKKICVLICGAALFAPLGYVLATNQNTNQSSSQYNGNASENTDKQRFVLGELLVTTFDEKNQDQLALPNFGFKDQNIQKLIKQYSFGQPQRAINTVPNVENNIKHERVAGFLRRTFKIKVNSGDFKSAMNALKTLQDVQHVEPNYIAKLATNDPYFNSADTWGQNTDDLWGLHAVKAENAWGQGYSGVGVKVAVIDTGVDGGHEDLSGRIVAGWNVLLNSPDVTDNYGHGTHIAGTIAALADNNLGIVGVAPGATIIPIKAMNDVGEGNVAKLSEALIWATDNGADIINASWGIYAQSEVLKNAIDYAHSNGVTIIAAAGNANTNVGYFYPAAYPNTIAVGAVNASLLKASISNYGAQIDVMAPGTNILSAIANGSLYEQLGSIPGTSLYGVANGTSSSAAYVSGIIALAKEANPALNPDQLKSLIRNKADELGAFGWDEIYGYGLATAADLIATPQSEAALYSKLDEPSYYSAAPMNVVVNDQVVVEGSSGGVDFAGYELTLAPILNRVVTENPTVVSQSTSPVSNGQLGVLDTSGLSNAEYLVELLTKDVQENTAKSSVVITVDHSLKTGWPQPTLAYGLPNGFENNAVAVANLDRSGAQEIIAARGFQVFAWSSDGQLLAGFPISLPITSSVLSAPAIGDLDGDGDLEIVVIAEQTMAKTSGVLNTLPIIHAYHHDGTVVAGFPSGQIDATALANGQSYRLNSNLTPPVLSDIDNDGDLEVIAQIGSGNQANQYLWLVVLNGDGSNYSNFPKTIDTEISTPSRALNIADLDGDGDKEILISKQVETGQLTSWSVSLMLDAIHHTGENYANTSFVSDSGLQDFQYENIIADLDSDGVYEIILVAPSSASFNAAQIVMLDNQLNPSIGWPKVIDNVSGRLAIADVDQDGKFDVLANHGTWGDLVSAWKQDGTTIYNNKVVSDKSSSKHNRLANYGLVCSSDAAGSNLGCFSSLSDEVSPGYGIAEQGIIGLDRNSDYLAGWPKSVGFASGGVTISDLDFDGNPEVVAQTATGLVFIWQETNLGITDNHWSTYMGNFARTGTFNDDYQLVYTGVVPVVDSCNATGSGYDITTNGSASDTDGDMTVVEIEFNNDGNWLVANGTSSFSYISTKDVGDHTVRARAQDLNANTSNIADCGSVAIDGVAPSVTMVNVAVNGSNVTVSGDASDADGDLSQVSVMFDDDGIWHLASGTDSWSLTQALSLGTHTVNVQAWDDRNNISIIVSGDDAVITVGANAPEVGSMDVIVSDKNIIVSGIASDTDGNLAAVEVNLDSAGWINVDTTGSWSHNYNNLSQGTHSVSVRAKDAGDLYSAETSITFKIAGDVASAQCFTAANSAHNSAGRAETCNYYQECAIGSGDNLGYSFTETTLEEQSAGSNYWTEVSSCSGGGGTAPNAPTIDSLVNGTVVDLSGTASDPDGDVIRVEVEFDTDGVWRTAQGENNWSYSISTLAVGSHTARARVVDSEGNIGAASETSFTIEAVGSAPTVDSAIASVINDVVTVSGSASDVDGDLTRVEVQFSNSNQWFIATGTDSWTVSKSDLPVGNYTAKVRAVDAQIRNSAEVSSNAFVIEGSAPNIDSIVAQESGDTVTVTGTASDADGANDLVQAQVMFNNSGSWVNASDTSNWSYTTNSLGYGSHTVKARIQDGFGHWSADSETINFDLVNPGVAPLVDSCNATGSGYDITTSGNASDIDGNLTVVEIEFNNDGNWLAATGSSSFSHTLAKGVGDHTLRARAKDATANTSNIVNCGTVAIDGVAPSVNNVNVVVNGSNVTVSGDASDADSDLSQVSVMFDDDGTWHAASGTTSWSLTQLLSLGTHTVKVQAWDSRTNVSIVVIGDNAEINGSAPVVNNNIEVSIDENNVTFTGSASDTDNDLDRIEIEIDYNGLWIVTTGTNSWAQTEVLSDGNHSVRARGFDNQGNASVLTSTSNFTVGANAPEVESMDVIVSDKNIVVSGIASDTDGNLAAVEVKLDSAGWINVDTTGSWSQNYNNLSQGTHSVSVRAKDAGDLYSAETSITFKIAGDVTGAQCFTAANSEHSSAGRAETCNYYQVCAIGSGDNLGYSFTETTLEEQPAGSNYWTEVSSCSGGGGTAPNAPTIDSLVNGTIVELSGTASDLDGDVIRVEVEFDTDGVWRTTQGENNWSYSISTLAVGSHTARARVVDSEGNIGATSETSFTIEAVGSAPIVDSAIVSVINDVVTVSGSASDEDGDLTRVEVQFSNSNQWFIATGTDNWTVDKSDLLGGNYTAKVRAVDAQSRNSAEVSTNAFVIEGSAPNIDSIVAQESGDTVTVTGTASDADGANDLVQVQVMFNNSGSWVNASDTSNWSYTTNTLGYGSHTVKARIQDGFGHWSADSETINFDLVNPGVAPLVDSCNATGSGYNITTSGNASDTDGDLTVVEIEFNNDGNWLAATGSSSFSHTLAKGVGDHSVRVRAQDSKTNTSTIVNCGTVIIDGVAPNVTSINVAIDGGNATVSGSAADADGDMVQVRIMFDDDGTWHVANGTSTWSFTQGFSSGNHNAKVQAHDSRGQSSVIEQRPFTIENQVVCYTATNSQHASNGRAYACGLFDLQRCANGSDTNLSYSGTTTSLQEQPAGSGYWDKVASCP